MSDYQLSEWEIKLGSRVRTLQQKVHHANFYDDISEFEREAHVCRAEVSHLYDYAQQHKVGLNYDAFVDIQTRLQDIEDRLNQLKNRPAVLKALSFIKDALVTAFKLVSFAAKFLGLPGLPKFPELPPGNK